MAGGSRFIEIPGDQAGFNEIFEVLPGRRIEDDVRMG